MRWVLKRLEISEEADVQCLAEERATVYAGKTMEDLIVEWNKFVDALKGRSGVEIPYPENALRGALIFR